MSNSTTVKRRTESTSLRRRSRSWRLRRANTAVTLGMALLAGAVASVASQPAAATANGQLERVDAVTLMGGENRLFSAVSDGTHAYFGTDTDPGRVVKVDRATMTRVGAVTLEAGEDRLFSAVSDGTHVYFGTLTSPGRVVKVQMSGATCAQGVDCGGMARVDAVTLAGERFLSSVVSDGAHAYFGTNTSPGRVVKVNLATLARVDAVTLEAGENGLVSVVSDGTYAYFGTDTDPGQVVKVNLATLVRVGSVTLEAGESFLNSAVSDGTHAYFGVGTLGRVVKVQLSGATCAQGVDCGGMARVGAVTLEAGENVLRSAVSDGAHAYFGTDDTDPGRTDPGRVVKVQMSGATCAQGVDCGGMARVGAVTLEAGEDRLFSAVSDGTHVYFGTLTSPGRVVKVRLQALTPAPPARPAVSVSCASFALVAGATVTCTVAGGDAGIEILWRAAYNPVFAEAGVTLDATGTGTFSFTVPAAALGEEVTVELVEWLAPVSLGVAAGPVPSSIPSGGGPMPVWSLVLLALAGGLVLRRMSAVGVRG